MKASNILIGLGAFFVLMVIIITASGGENKEEKSQSSLQQTESQKTEAEIQAEAEKEKIKKQETEYLEAAMKINKNVEDAIACISNLLKEKPLPILWTDEEIVKAAAHTVIIEQSYKDAKGLYAPPRFQKAHSLFLSSLEKYAQAMPLLRSGIDNLNAEEINQATALINEGADLTKQATKELEKLNK